MMRRLNWAAAVVLLGGVAGAVGQAASAGKAGKSYRITGVAVSKRDGSPIPYCRLEATSAALNSAPSGLDGPDFGSGGTGARLGRQRGVGRPGGGGGFGGGGRGGAGSATPEDGVVTADASGHFVIDLPHLGAWRVVASAKGFRRQDFDEHEGFYSDIVVGEAAPVADIVYKLEPNGTVEGLVLDEAGEAVRGAQVALEAVTPASPGHPFATGQSAGFSQTDDRGRYEFAELQPGSYRVRVQAFPWYASSTPRQFGGRPGQPAAPSPDPSLDLVYPMTWYPGVDAEAAAGTIALGGGEDRQADFHLLPSAAIHLKIAGPPGEAQRRGPDGGPRDLVQVLRAPQRGATITRVSSGGSAFGQVTSMTSGGDLDFGGLSPGLYEVQMQGADGEGDGVVRQIEITPGSVREVTLEGAKTLTKVTVMLDGPGADDGPVGFVDVSTGRRVSLTGGFGGRFRMRRGNNGDDNADPRERTVYLAPHRYVVEVSSGMGYVTAMEATGAVVTGQGIDVGSSPATVRLHMEESRVDVSGYVRNDGVGVGGAMVLLVPATLGVVGAPQVPQRDQTNSDGSFRVRGVVPGNYILLAIDHGWDVNWRDPQTLTGYLMQGVPVEVKPGVRVKLEIVAQKP